MWRERVDSLAKGLATSSSLEILETKSATGATQRHVWTAKVDHRAPGWSETVKPNRQQGNIIEQSYEADSPVKAAENETKLKSRMAETTNRLGVEEKEQGRWICTENT